MKLEETMAVEHCDIVLEFTGLFQVWSYTVSHGSVITAKHEA